MRQRRRMFVCIDLVIMCLVFALMVGCKETSEAEFTQISTEDMQGEELEQVETEAEEKENIEETKEIYVFVCGEVRNPGVYKLMDGDRITHALFAAGGMTDQAAEEYLNQAEILSDGQKIYVPDKKEANRMRSSEGDSLSGNETRDGKVNINTADKSELTQLSGIGASRADAILAYREANGRFTRIEDVKKVDGIKDGIFEKIKEQIKVE